LDQEASNTAPHLKDRRATSENKISGGAGRENDGCSDEAAAVKEGL
jgi:hypothetical protein